MPPAASSSNSAFTTLAPISAGCAVSAGCMYPVDIVRALRMASASEAAALSTAQLLRNFVHAHGLLGLMSQGVLPEISRATAMRVIQFFSYPLMHEMLFARRPSEGSPATKCVAGMAASLPSSVAIVPLENAKIALQLDQTGRFRNSMGAAMQHLWRRGFFAPYAGLQGTFTRSAVSFGPYIATLPYFQSITKPACRSAVGDTPCALPRDSHRFSLESGLGWSCVPDQVRIRSGSGPDQGPDQGVLHTHQALTPQPMSSGLSRCCV